MVDETAVKNTSNTVIYSGSDIAYWSILQERLKNTYPGREFEFLTLFNASPESYQDVFLEFLEYKALIIYIDFSINLKSQMKLCLSLKRVSNTNDTAVVGLIDNTELSRECWSSGADINHVKCGEYHDVIYHAMKIAAPKVAIVPDFAVARFEKDVTLIEDFRIGYVSGTTLHAEGNFSLKKGETVEIATDIPQDVMPSRSFTLKESHKTGMYYDFSYTYEFEHKFVDTPPKETKALKLAKTEDDESKKKFMIEEAEDQIRQLHAEYDKKLKVTKKKVKAWVVDNSDSSNAKVTKILLVSERMGVLKGEKFSIDQYPYTIRMQTILHDPYLEIEKLRPDIIAINFLEEVEEEAEEDTVIDDSDEADEVDEGDAPVKASASATANSKVMNIIKKVKGIESYTPFVILFNCPNLTSKALQDSYEYPLTIAYTLPMKMEEIIKMANLFETKQTSKKAKFIDERIIALRKEDPVKNGKLNKSDFEETRYYIRKSNSLSYASIKRDVKLVTMTESELTIKTTQPLALGKYRLEEPIKCTIKLIAIEGENFIEKDDAFIQKGLIHFIDENEKKEVRKYVNDIFFSDLNEERAADDALAEQAKEDALKSKEEAEVAEAVEEETRKD